MIRETLTIINKRGLHARASAKLNQLVLRFDSKVFIEVEGRRSDARNIMAIMMLAASIGTELTVEVDGPDEQEAFTAIANLINNYFEEGE